MARLIKKYASGKILSIEDFTFNLLDSIKQNKNLIKLDKFSQEFKNDDFKLPEFKSILLNDINTGNLNTSEEQKIEEDKGENSETLSFLKIPTQEVKKENNKMLSFLKMPTQEVKAPQKNINKSFLYVKSSQPAGIKTFNEAFDKVQTRIPEIKKYKKLLTELAERESTFRPDAAAKNTRGIALGYFQFMPFNRKNISPKDFVDNPELQIEMA